MRYSDPNPNPAFALNRTQPHSRAPRNLPTQHQPQPHQPPRYNRPQHHKHMVPPHLPRKSRLHQPANSPPFHPQVPPPVHHPRIPHGPRRPLVPRHPTIPKNKTNLINRALNIFPLLLLLERNRRHLARQHPPRVRHGGEVEPHRSTAHAFCICTCAHFFICRERESADGSGESVGRELEL